MKEDLIFMCYAREDKLLVKEAYHHLKNDGLPVWLDGMDLLPGQNWQQVTIQTLKKSSFILIFFSKHSVTKRGFVQREFKVALDTLNEIPDDQIFIIPVRLDNCDIPEKFKTIHCIDLFEEGSYEKIIKAIKTEIERESILYSSSLQTANSDSINNKNLKVKKKCRDTQAPERSAGQFEKSFAKSDHDPSLNRKDGLIKLSTLVLDLFSYDDLRQIIYRLPEGESLVNQLPSLGASRSEFVISLIEKIVQLGIHGEFFDVLYSLRPNRKTDIETVESLWT